MNQVITKPVICISLYKVQIIKFPHDHTTLFEPSSAHLLSPIHAGGFLYKAAHFNLITRRLYDYEIRSFKCYKTFCFNVLQKYFPHCLIFLGQSSKLVKESLEMNRTTCIPC